MTISDQGREFVNAVTKYLFDMTGAEHCISSAYHPKTNIVAPSGRLPSDLTSQWVPAGLVSWLM